MIAQPCSPCASVLAPAGARRASKLGDEGVDLFVGREAPELVLGEHQLAVGEHFEHAVSTLDELDVFRGLG